MTKNPGKPKRKHRSGLAIFAAIILLIIVQTQYMSVERTYCEGEVPVPDQRILLVVQRISPFVCCP
jgi:hypothetical protein